MKSQLAQKEQRDTGRETARISAALFTIYSPSCSFSVFLGSQSYQHLYSAAETFSKLQKDFSGPEFSGRAGKSSLKNRVISYHSRANKEEVCGCLRSPGRPIGLQPGDRMPEGQAGDCGSQCFLVKRRCHHGLSVASVRVAGLFRSTDPCAQH